MDARTMMTAARAQQQSGFKLTKAPPPTLMLDVVPGTPNPYAQQPGLSTRTKIGLAIGALGLFWYFWK